MRVAMAQSEAHRSPVAEPRPPSVDVRDDLFAGLRGASFPFGITACEPGVLAGAGRIAAKAVELGIRIEWLAEDGARLEPGAHVCRARGDAWQVARAEEHFIALVAKASGVATAAASLVAQAGGRARIVCGAWKKVSAEVRAALRDAAAVGGVGTRILDTPFVYLDKNYVRMLGGVGSAVRRARGVPGRAVVVQLRGETARITDEAREALAEGAAVLMVDTGRLADLAAVAGLAESDRLGAQTQLAFAGSIGPASLHDALEAGATILDVGRAILDAPMIDLRLDVT